MGILFFVYNLLQPRKLKLDIYLTKQFTYDLCAINDDEEFRRNNAEIYPKELELMPELQCTYASFLNLDINIVDGKIVHKLYENRDFYSGIFFVKVPNIDSNTPNDIFYSTFVAKTLNSTFLKFCPKSSGIDIKNTTARSQIKKLSFVLEKSYK